MSDGERMELVDLVAQAVIDRIEERERISRLADMVVARVITLQQEDHNLQSQEEKDNEQ